MSRSIWRVFRNDHPYSWLAGALVGTVGGVVSVLLSVVQCSPN